MSRRIRSFHIESRSDQRYIDACLADCAWRRVERLHTDQNNPTNITTRKRSVGSKSDARLGDDDSVRPTAKRPSRFGRRRSTRRAVSFVERSKKSNPKTHRLKSESCTGCRKRLSFVTSSTSNRNNMKPRSCVQSRYSTPPQDDKRVENRPNKKQISQVADKGNIREKRRKKEISKKTEVVKYELSIGFTVKRNIKSENRILADKFETLNSERQTREVKRSTEVSFSNKKRRPRSFSGHQSKDSRVLPSEKHRTVPRKSVLKNVPSLRLRKPVFNDNTEANPHRPTSNVYQCTENNDRADNRILQRNQSYQQSAFTFGDDFKRMKTEMSKKPVRIHLLNNDSVVLVFETKATVQQLFDQVCSLQSIKETQFFGLSTVVDNEKWFMDHKHRIAKYAPKEWGKEIKRRASDLAVSASAVLTVQFQVQFYVEHPKLISDKTSRYLYYLQMKKNVLKSTVLLQDEVLFTIASYALQADLGDHNPTKHTKQYFKPEDYFPSWFVEKWGRDYLLSHLPSLHAENNGKTAYESQAFYIQQASAIDDVPVHYYKLSKNKKETKPSVLLGIFHQGIRIHYGDPEKSSKTPWKLEFEFMWSKVGRLFFTGKRFEIYPDDLPSSRRLIYYTGSHARSKYLLHFLRETHSVYLTLSPYAQQMRKLDGKRARRKYRESYISGQNLNSDSTEAITYGQQSVDKDYESNKENPDKGKLGKTCYQSMTSHGSSHTSGIESDSKQRTEEDEEDEAGNYADDFDPIEHDHRKDSVYITEDHLSAPPPKSLSVSNLVDLQDAEAANDDTITPQKGATSERGQEKSSKPSRDSTLTGEDLCISSVLPSTRGSNSSEQKTPKYSSMSSENREDTLKNGVPLETLMNAVMKNAEHAVMRNSDQDVSKVKKRVSSKSKRDHRKQVTSLIDSSTQTTPSRYYRDIFYFGDFDLVPRKPRGRSLTDEPKSARDYHSNGGTSRRHQKHSKQPHQHRHDHTAKRASTSHDPNHDNSAERQSFSSNNTFLWRPSNKPPTRTYSAERRNPEFLPNGAKVKCHHGSAFSIPSNFQTNLEHDRPSAFVTVGRPKKHTVSNERGYYTVARGYDTYGHHDNSSSYENRQSLSARNDKRHSYYEQFYYTDSSDNHGRLSSFEEDDFTQKMSEVCMRTLSAQRRKLSDSKFSQRMDSGRGSLRTNTDDSSSCMDMSPTTHAPPDFISIPQPSSSRSAPAPYDLLRTPYIENYNEVIV